jgi:hypothetical protein
MDSISSFLSGIIPEINEKLSKECEKLKMDYIKGLYRSADEWTENYGLVDIEYIKTKLITSHQHSEVNQLFMKGFEEISGLIKDNNRYIIHSYIIYCRYIGQSQYESDRFVPSFLIIIDIAFNIYEIRILERLTNCWGPKYIYDITINNPKDPYYNSLYELKTFASNVSKRSNYDIICKTGLHNSPLSNILIDKIKQIFCNIVSIEINACAILNTQVQCIQATFIELNKKSHENMLMIANIQRMLSEKEDHLAKITAELKEANKKLIIISTKKGHKIKLRRVASIKTYIQKFKLKHKKD